MNTTKLVKGVAFGALVITAGACIIQEKKKDKDDDGPTVLGFESGGETTTDAPGVGGGRDNPPPPPQGGGDPGPATPDPSPADGPGGACNCDSDCPAVEGHDGVCVYGVCMTYASAECSSSGSTAECPTASKCWGMEGKPGSLCWPECATYACDGECASDGICEPSSSTNCHISCGDYCSCNPGDCPSGEVCVSGSCVAESTGDGPGAGPGPSCTNLPPRDCTGSATYCSALVTFDPRTTAHYDDYPINGETSSNQYRSYLRRDLAMLVDYATAKVLCKSAGWTTGNGGALGMGDMSEANGAIPGTSINQPGHPAGTHTDGFDIDMAYYQRNTSDNRLRAVCTNADYHCTAEPHLLDVWRTAMFLGVLFESNRTRVIGVDGQVGILVQPALAELCNTGWLTSAACNNIRLAYEVTDQGYGWFRFHHHHMHMSLCPGSVPCTNAHEFEFGRMPCYGTSCNGAPLRANPHWFGPTY